MSAPSYKRIEDIVSGKAKLTSDELRRKLKLKQIESSLKFRQKNAKFEKLFVQKGAKISNLREYSAKIIGAGTLTGLLFLSSPSETPPLPSLQEIVRKVDDDLAGGSSKQQALLVNSIASLLPKHHRPLEQNEKKILEQVISQTTGIKVRASLEGESLNTVYGKVGIEQHLRRYPGDTLVNHGGYNTIKEGMAPGLGAWGYFANSKEKITPQLEEIEKWYAVVQTLYLPDWNKRQPYLKEWYKYRKVMLVNTKNGQAVVTAIADAGPAAWTGKNFGASPETMLHLGGGKYTKGEVLVFFVDDPENKIPLGPVDYGTQLSGVGLIKLQS